METAEDTERRAQKSHYAVNSARAVCLAPEEVDVAQRQDASDTQGYDIRRNDQQCPQVQAVVIPAHKDGREQAGYWERAGC